MLSYEEMRQKLEATLTPHRYAHSIGVMDTAVSLAKRYGADVEKCRIAGLLHDCAKKLEPEEMLEIIRAHGIKLYPGEENYPQLLHAPAGAAIAEEEYGVSDKEILSAIRAHTVGAPDMSLIDTIILVSDFIEPGRKPFEGLETVREKALCDLQGAKELCSELTRAYCEEQGQTPFSF